MKFYFFFKIILIMICEKFENFINEFQENVKDVFLNKFQYFTECDNDKYDYMNEIYLKKNFKILDTFCTKCKTNIESIIDFYKNNKFNEENYKFVLQVLNFPEENYKFILQILNFMRLYIFCVKNNLNIFDCNKIKFDPNCYLFDDSYFENILTTNNIIKKNKKICIDDIVVKGLKKSTSQNNLNKLCDDKLFSDKFVEKNNSVYDRNNKTYNEDYNENNCKNATIKTNVKKEREYKSERVVKREKNNKNNQFEHQHFDQYEVGNNIEDEDKNSISYKSFLIFFKVNVLKDMKIDSLKHMCDFLDIKYNKKFKKQDYIDIIKLRFENLEFKL